MSTPRASSSDTTLMTASTSMGRLRRDWRGARHEGLQWNALKVGDNVLVHDATRHVIRLLPGVVSVVDTGTDEPARSH